MVVELGSYNVSCGLSSRDRPLEVFRSVVEPKSERGIQRKAGYPATTGHTMEELVRPIRRGKVEDFDALEALFYQTVRYPFPRFSHSFLRNDSHVHSPMFDWLSIVLQRAQGRTRRVPFTSDRLSAFIFP